MANEYRVPAAIVVGVILYCITSVPAAVYFAADMKARLQVVEQETNNVPARLAVLESRLNDMTVVLRDIRDELRKRNAN